MVPFTCAQRPSGLIPHQSTPWALGLTPWEMPTNPWMCYSLVTLVFWTNYPWVLACPLCSPAPAASNLFFKVQVHLLCEAFLTSSRDDSFFLKPLAMSEPWLLVWGFSFICMSTNSKTWEAKTLSWSSLYHQLPEWRLTQSRPPITIANI